MTKPTPNTELGPESSVPPESKTGDAFSSPGASAPAQTPPGKRISRLDAEIEKLRRSPTPTQAQGTSADRQRH